MDDIHKHNRCKISANCVREQLTTTPPAPHPFLRVKLLHMSVLVFGYKNILAPSQEKLVGVKKEFAYKVFEMEHDENKLLRASRRDGDH